MLQRVAKFSKKPEAAAPAFASVSASDIIRAPVVQKAIPLEFAGILAPYKKRHGRLSLRVEEMPQRARLSAGRNNGDGSWSLASDELEGLTYLIPANLAREHTLVLRIMAFDDAGASTLKILHFPVPLQLETSEAAEENPAAAPGAADPILHNELGRMQSLFAVRESELTQLRLALEQAKTQKEAELASARAAWELEVQVLLSEAAAQAKSEGQSERTAWQTAQGSRTAQAQALAEQKIAQERDRWQLETQQRLDAERERWKTETQKLLSAAITEERKQKQAQIQKRVDAERERWKTESEGLLSEAIAKEHKQWQAQTQQRIETERERWKAESQGPLSEAIAQERKQWQVQTQQQLEAERARWKTESQAALSDAIAQERKQWLAQTQQRIEAERERGEAESQAALSDAIAQERKQWLTQTQQRIEAERECWKAEGQGVLSGTIAEERRQWQAQTQQRIEAERERWKAESQIALSEAEARWKADEAGRLAAAVVEWRQQSSQMLADASEKHRELERALEQARAQPNNAAAADGGEAESARLRTELARMQSILTQRDLDLAQHRTELQQERERERQVLETALSTAAEAWKTEAARLAGAVTKSSAQSDALAIATARYEAAELALAESGNQDAAALKRRDDAYVEGLRRELKTLRANLVNREVELGRARAALERPIRVQSPANVPVQGQLRNFASSDEEQADTGASRRLVRDFIVAVCVIAPLIFFYPRLGVYLPDNLQANIASLTGGFLSTYAEPAPQIHAAVPLVPPVVKRPSAIVNHAVNVRATAATTGAVVLTLQRGAPVTVLERRGNWTLIETLSGKAKPLQGFVFSSYLKDKP
jgi:Bacterial SH3 domain